MLGYVLPDKSELKLKEYEIYSGYYCGICKYIGHNFGQLPRMALSYDAAFLALLLECILDEEDVPTQEHCIVHHIKYKTVIRNDAIEYAGDLMLILAWFKLLDDARDEGSLSAKATVRLLKGHYDRLRKKHPTLCGTIGREIKTLTALENKRTPGLDEAAEPFARIMKTIFAEGIGYIIKEEKRSKKNPEDMDVLHETFAKIGYHMGKWIYLIDAADDIEENLESGAYNPLLYRFDYDAGSETTEEFRKRIDDDLRFNLFNYLAATAEAVDSLDIKKNSGIIENIVYFGLNRTTDEVLKRLPPPNRRKLSQRP